MDIYHINHIWLYVYSVHIFQALMTEINLSEDLVYYFGLFLIKRAEDGEATSKLIHCMILIMYVKYVEFCVLVIKIL